MLYDPQRNTEMAALYLDILFSAYHDKKLVLAEYNGGPMNAGYLRADSALTADETRDYVVKVLDVYGRLEKKFERGVEVRLEAKHRDIAREGKVLPDESSVSAQ
jgi:soluble lytic murein transglycosylase-like protein